MADPIDQLTYSYTGNQLLAVDDAVTTNNFNDFFDHGHYYYITRTPEFLYDANGNLTQDLNKEIVNITYNELNLPKIIDFKNNSRIEYQYDALGVKKRQLVTEGGKLVKTTDFIGNFVYENNYPVYNIFDEGRLIYMANGTYFAETYIKDHLGNIRVAYGNELSGDTQQYGIRQVNAYYPFGMSINPLTANKISKYKRNEFVYNGKMFQDELGLDWLDYGFRFYDPQIGRWHVVDPLAEKSRRWSPYSYCYNNPLIFVDLDGLKPVWNGKYGDESKYIDDETNKEVSWNQVQNYMNYGNYDGPKELENNNNESSHTITPFRVGEEWLSGKGEKNRTFVGGDYFTELLKGHDHIVLVKETIAKLIKKGILSGKNDYQLNGLQGVGKYLKDYSTLLTFGLSGNLAVTYLGSYSLTWSVVKINGNEATVLFEVKNSSTIQSGTRPPVLGYTSLWQNTAGKALDNSFSTGALSKTTQKFNWTEKITIK